MGERAVRITDDPDQPIGCNGCESASDYVTVYAPGRFDAAAKGVLVEVTVSGGARATVLKISAGRKSTKVTVPAGRRKTVTLRLGVSAARKLVARLSTRATVLVTRVGWTM